MGQYFEWSISTTAETDTSVSKRLIVVYRTTLSVDDSVNDFAVSGDWPAYSGALNIDLGAGGSLTAYDTTAVFTKVYGATQTKTFAASLSGVEYWGGSISTNGSTTVAARPYSVPTAPSGVSATRVSDTQHTVSWTRTASASAPVTSQAVQRSTDGAAWATVTTIATDYTTTAAQSWSDTTTSADHSYAYRVIASNSSGSATSAASGTLYTTPKAPGTPSAVKSGSNIVLTFTNTARHDTGVKVYASQDGAAFALLTTVATANLTTWTHTAPSSAVTWAYKVATYNGALISALSAASPTVQLLAAPNAPTGLGPSAVRDATDPVTLVWTHNPVDTTAQTAFQVRHREVGAPTWTTETAVTSGVSSWVLPASTYANPITAEWQVATRGEYATYSPWSATATLPSSARPTATITGLDGSVVATSTLTVPWVYYDAEGSDQTAWQVELLDSTGALVDHSSGVGAVASVAMTTTLPNTSSWSVRVRVQDGAGMWSAWDVAAFTVTYALPPTPTVVLTWDPDAATITVAVTNPAPVDLEIATDHVDVYRSIDGGPLELIATGAPPNTTLTDFSPTVAGTNLYQVHAVSALPSVVTATAEAVTSGTTAVFISGGPGYSVVCRAHHDVEITDMPGRERVLRRFAGRAHPVEFTGESLERVLTLAADLVADSLDSDPAEWLTLADLPGPHLWRDPDGRRLMVSLSTPKLARPVGGVMHALALSATQVDS